MAREPPDFLGAAGADRAGLAPTPPAPPRSPLRSRGQRGSAGCGDAGQLATPRVAALALPTVGEWVFVVYASFGSAAESQVIGVASSAARAEELAERYAEEDGFAWRGPDRLEWDSARRVRPAVDGRGDAVEVWTVEVGLDELTRFALETEPLIEEH